MYISQNYKSFDEIFKFKLSLFELINKIEMQDVDASQKLIGQLEKAQTSIKEKESIKQDSILIKLLHSYLFKYNAKWRPVKKDIEKFITDYPIDERQSGIINYSNWLQEKV